MSDLVNSSLSPRQPSAVPVSQANAAIRPRLDWTRNPPPANLSPFQEFTRNVDWERSPLGPMDAWPDQLRQTVLLIMADPNPAVVYWGDDMTIVYNEAYTGPATLCHCTSTNQLTTG